MSLPTQPQEKKPTQEELILAFKHQHTLFSLGNGDALSAIGKFRRLVHREQCRPKCIIYLEATAATLVTEASEILEGQLYQEMAYMNWHGMKMGVALAVWESFCNIYSHIHNVELEGKGFCCWDQQTRFQKDLMEGKEMMRLGDVFELSKKLNASEKRFLRLFLDLFHIVQERREPFPAELKKLVGMIVDPEERYVDDFNIMVFVNPIKEIYFKSVFWGRWRDTGVLWHFHLIKEIKPIYGNGMHQAPTNIVAVCQYHWAVPDHTDEYSPEELSECRKTFQYFQQVCDKTLDLAGFRLASELLVGERKKGK